MVKKTPAKTKKEYDRERYLRIKNDPVLWAKRQAQKEALSKYGSSASGASLGDILGSVLKK